MEKFDVTDCLKKNGVLLLNTTYDFEELNRVMPNKMKGELIDKNISVYCLDANSIAFKHGLGGKINTIMQTATFYVSKLLPFEKAFANIKNSIKSKA